MLILSIRIALNVSPFPSVMIVSHFLPPDISREQFSHDYPNLTFVPYRLVIGNLLSVKLLFLSSRTIHPHLTLYYKINTTRLASYWSFEYDHNM